MHFGDLHDAIAPGSGEHGVHFFLDFRRKEPYKGDTTALY